VYYACHGTARPTFAPGITFDAMPAAAAI